MQDAKLMSIFWMAKKQKYLFPTVTDVVASEFRQHCCFDSYVVTPSECHYITLHFCNNICINIQILQ